MSKWYTSQCPVLVDLTKALREVGLEWLTLNLEHAGGWTIKGTARYRNEPKQVV